MLQSMYVQLVFVRDMILYTRFIDDWEANKRRKQQLVDKNNQNKNKITDRKTIKYVVKY